MSCRTCAVMIIQGKSLGGIDPHGNFRVTSEFIWETVSLRWPLGIHPYPPRAFFLLHSSARRCAAEAC
jgi:hypothetical protein